MMLCWDLLVLESPWLQQIEACPSIKASNEVRQHISTEPATCVTILQLISKVLTRNPHAVRSAIKTEWSNEHRISLWHLSFIRCRFKRPKHLQGLSCRRWPSSFKLINHQTRRVGAPRPRLDLAQGKALSGVIGSNQDRNWRRVAGQALGGGERQSGEL